MTTGRITAQDIARKKLREAAGIREEPISFQPQATAGRAVPPVLPPGGQEFTTETGERFKVMPDFSVYSEKNKTFPVGKLDFSDPLNPKFVPSFGQNFIGGIAATQNAQEIAAMGQKPPFHIRLFPGQGEAELNRAITNFLREPTGVTGGGAITKEAFQTGTQPRWQQWLGIALEQTPYLAMGTSLGEGSIMGGLGKMPFPKGEILKPKIKVPKVEIPTEMPTIKELIAANYNPNMASKIGQKLTQAPGIIGNVNKRLLPMQAATTDAERATIAWGTLREDIAPNLARFKMSAVRAEDYPFAVDMKTGLARNVTPKSPEYKPYIQAIAEFPDRYILTTAQRAELNVMDNLLKEQLARELSAGVKVRPVGLKEGQRYIPRIVSEIQDLETQAIAEIRAGTARRPGVKPGSFRTRYYDEVLQGVASGIKYRNDLRAVVETRIAAGNKAIADKMFADYLKPLGKTPLERMPAGIKQEAWETSREYAGIRQFQKVTNRAIRGETLTEQTLQAQERRFPELGAQLRQLITENKLNEPAGERMRTMLRHAYERKTQKGIIQIPEKEFQIKQIITRGTELLERAKALEPTLQTEYWAARRLATKALARARIPILGKEGMINHAGLQGEIFPIDISDPVNALIRRQITSSQVLNQLAKLNAVARMGQTAIDFGPPLIQGQLTLANHPKAWAKAWWISLKTLVNPKYTNRYLQSHSSTVAKIIRNEGAPFGGSEFTEAGRAGGWLSKIPGVRKVIGRFGTWFESFLDTARIQLCEINEALYKAKLGRELTPREMTDIVTTGDHMVGISSLQRLGIGKLDQQLAQNTLYAPRYYTAFVSLIGRAFQGGIGGDIARKGLAKLLIAMPLFMSAMAVALGQKERIIPTEDKPIPIMFDPTGGELMTVEIGGVHMGLGGIYVSAFRLLGSIAKSAIDSPRDFISIDPHENPILRSYYSHSSPVAGGVIDIATGRNYLGERLDTPMAYLKEVVNKTFPFWAAGTLTDVPRGGWSYAVANWWGLRVWQVQYRELAQEWANQHIKDIPPEMMMPEQKGRALKYEDLNNEQRAWLLSTYSDYRELEEKRREQVERTGTDTQIGIARTREALDTQYNADLRDVASGVVSGKINIGDYLNQTEYLRRIRQGTYQFQTLYKQLVPNGDWEEAQKWLEENTKPEDKAYDAYMELRGNPPEKAGVPDWDAWKVQIDKYLNGLDPDTRAYILRRQDDWINNLPPEAQKVERLLQECEVVFDGYYGVAPMAGTQTLATRLSKARLAWRQTFPEVDAKLLLSGRVTTLQTTDAAWIVVQLLSKYGITASPAITLALSKAGGQQGGLTPPTPLTPQEIARKKLREAVGLD